MNANRFARCGLRLFLSFCGASLLLLLAVLAVYGAGSRGAWSTTDFQLLNLSPYPQSFTAHFFSPAGSEVYSMTGILPPGETAYYLPEDELPPGFTGTLYVDAPEGLLAMGIVHLDQMLGDDGNEVFTALWDEDLAQTAYTPIDPCTILRIHNASASNEASVTVHVLRPDGSVAREVPALVPPEGLVAIWPAVDPGIPLNFVGAAVVQADQPVEVTTLNVCGGLAAYVAPSHGDTLLVAPRVPPLHLGLITTTISLQNTLPISVAGQISFSSGQTTDFLLLPHGSTVVSSPFTNTTGSAIISADGPVVAVVSSVNGQSTGPGVYAYPAFSHNEATRAVALPVLFSGYGGWDTGDAIWVRNVSGMTATVRLRLIGALTDELFWLEETVGPGKTWQVTLPPMEAERAAAIILADQPIVALAGATASFTEQRDGDIRYRGSNFIFDCESVSGVAFSRSAAMPWLGQSVFFTATVLSGSEPISYSWDLGDETQATGPLVSHTYLQAGWFTVTMTATNCLGFGEGEAAHSLFVRSDARYLPLLSRDWRP